jgi:hypothetical protein
MPIGLILLKYSIKISIKCKKFINEVKMENSNVNFTGKFDPVISAAFKNA